MKRVITFILLLLICISHNSLSAQNLLRQDSVLYNRKLDFNFYKPRSSSLFSTRNQESIKYNFLHHYYQIENKHSNSTQYLTHPEYIDYQLKTFEKEYWNELINKKISQDQINWFKARGLYKPTFNKLFGGHTIEIIPRGNIDINLAGEYNKNENPFINERLRKQWGFNFDQNINANITAKIGERATFLANFNSQAQFDFENQIRFDYIGKEDDIIKRIEIGNVNFSLNTSLIQGSESLFGFKAQLQYGKFSFTGLLAQKKSTTKEIILNNGSQEGKIDLKITDYEANQHYFLAQYFRENYNQALALAPFINSPIQILKIELWLSNKTNAYQDSRNIIALLDLAESNPFNPNIKKTSNLKIPSSRIPGQQNEESNDLIERLGIRENVLNTIQNFFANSGSTDNYAKINSARKLIENQDYTINKKLGYISLTTALHHDQILSVAYRYSFNGKEYQVGEFSTDIPITTNSSPILYTKLLKNEILKPQLPTWDLMMKNIYPLQASNLSEQNFSIQILRTDEQNGSDKNYIFEGINIHNKTWLELTHLDLLTQNQAQGSDNQFDWLPDITIDTKTGKLIFPLVEPFGKDLVSKFSATEQVLVEKYTFPELYRYTKNDAEQQFPNKNRYKIQGTFSTGSNNEFYLGTINLQPESLHVKSGGLQLVENSDYSIDYDIGLLRIINPTLLFSGHPITVTIENENLYASEQKTLIAGRLEYKANKNLQVGSSILKLDEKPIYQKASIGNEPISNTIYGIDINYSKNSQWLTKLVNKIPFIETEEPSFISFYGEIARMNPSYSRRTNNERDQNGVSYIDDFENNFRYIDLKPQSGWQISATPQLFREANLNNDLAYGYNRALLAVYNIDPIFHQPTHLNPNLDSKYLTDHRTRRITEQEVFPLKEARRGTESLLNTLDFAFYPKSRGPHNYNTTALSDNGEFTNPQQKWGGVFKKIEQTDFETQNIEFLELWLMDPTLTNPNLAGGDVYFNLGNITEDILKDGRKSTENALSINNDEVQTEQTVWGKVSKKQPLVQTFENTNESRLRQDVGLDGLNNEQEQTHFSNFLTRLQGILIPTAFEKIKQDPSTDDYIYFRGNHFDQQTSILERYKFINGTQGNSRTSEQSLQDFGVELSARTLLPDAEDINQDNIMNETEEYYQYRFSTRTQDLIVGKNHIVDEHISTTQISNKNVEVKWYKIRIPLSNYESKIGQIQDFKSIRFIRIFLNNFADTTVLRFAKMQFVSGEWRKYNAENTADKVISDPSLGIVPTDNSTFHSSNINIEENGNRYPIPYVIPPGIERQKDYVNNNRNIQQNEQAISLQVFNLKDGYGRAIFKTAQHDFRPYGRLEMFVHAEGDQLSDGDVHAFIRIGSDDKFHYYEYEQPLIVTPKSTTSPELIWPSNNNINIQLLYFQEAKLARDKANKNGLPWPPDIPFNYYVDNHKITICGTPDLSNIKFYMIGIKNPLRANSNTDNGQAISGEFWFNELRLTDFDTKGGWSTLARLNIKLADLANIALTANTSSIGFGSIHDRIGQRNRSNQLFYDFTSNIELGKFFKSEQGIQIPFYFNYSRQINTPEYNPLAPDIKLNQSLSALNDNQQDSLLKIVREFTNRKSFSFVNVRKINTNPLHEAKLWDIENFGLSFTFSEMHHRNFNTNNNLHRNYRAAIDYNYSNSNLQFAQPFRQIRSNNLAFIRDFTYNLMPSLVSFRLEVNRIYRENTFRDNSTNNILPTYYNKDFNINKIYGISWDLTKSLRIDFNTTNYAIIDEPNGRIDGAKLDTLWNNLWKMGRTTDYNHMMNITYNLPIDKLPYLDWITISSRYGTQFNWQSEPLITRKAENINIGNSIQNNRTIQLNPTINFNTLYNKFGFIRRNRSKNTSFSKAFLIQLLTSARHLNAAYTKNKGTYLPGYIPNTNLLGYDFSSNAPGFGFLFGSQTNILSKAFNNKWLTIDTLQNNQYVRTHAENLSGIINLEPFKSFRIDLTFLRIHNFNNLSTLRYDVQTDQFIQSATFTTGNYTISQIGLKSSFRKNTELIETFNLNKQETSISLAENNINSVGVTKDQFADGYGSNQQDVIINAFLNTYYQKKSNIHHRKPTFPLPNWRLNYTGLTTLLAIQDVIQSINIAHTYQSQYIISSYYSNTLYQEQNGMVYTRDYSNNFIAKYQYNSISSIDRFLPLIGVDIRLKNALSIHSEYRKGRDINLNMSNSQLAIQEEKSTILGIGYRKNNVQLPFGWYQNKRWKNDVNFKLDLALNDRKTSVYRTDFQYIEVTAGNHSITLNPSLDYTINRYYNIRIFYNSNLVQPYTSQNYTTAYTYFGINLRLQFQ